MTLNIVNSRRRLRQIIIIFIFAAFFQALIGVLEYIFNIQLSAYQQDLPAYAHRVKVGSSFKVRVSGTWGSNYFATLLAGVLPFTVIMFYIAKKNLKKTILLTAFITMVMGIIFSFTRIAMLSAIGGFSLLLFKKRSKISPAKIFLSVFILILIVGIVYYSNSSLITAYMDRIKTIPKILNYDAINFSDPKQDMAIASRLVHYKEAVRMIYSNPFFGVGPGNSLNEMARHDYPEFAGEIHNMFLLLAAEYGMIALFVYFWIIFLTWKNCLEVERTVEGQGDNEMQFIIIGLQCSLLANLIAFQAQPVIFPLNLIILYSLSGAIKHNIFQTKGAGI